MTMACTLSTDIILLSILFPRSKSFLRVLRVLSVSGLIGGRFCYSCSKPTHWSRLRTSLFLNQTGVGSLPRAHHDQRLQAPMLSRKSELSYSQARLVVSCGIGYSSPKRVFTVRRKELWSAGGTCSAFARSESAYTSAPSPSSGFRASRRRRYFVP
jgi:hypothetical protein